MKSIQAQNMNSDYSRKMDEELSRYKEVAYIHELPDIHHYWSGKYLTQMIQSYGFSSINDIYVHYMRAACARNPEKTMRFISIGAGNCELEVALAADLAASGHTNFIFECLDINPDMLGRGEQLAKDQGIAGNMQFRAEDLNYWDVQYSYDVIMASQCLHHFVELEMIFDKIYRYLSPDGYFITHDMIGRNGHMRWPEALTVLNEFWEILPEKYKYNHQLQRHEPEFMDWDCSNVGFEGIRAQDILPLLVKKFHFEFFIYWGGIIDVFVDRSFGHNFDPEVPWDKAFIDKVQQVNFEKTLEGTIKPTQMIAAMSKKEATRKFYWQGLSPYQCVRNPHEAAPHIAPIAENIKISPIKQDDETGNYHSFIFVHVPKCAGTSVREYIYKTGLMNNIPKDKMHVPGYGGLAEEKNISQLSAQELKDFRESEKIILAAHGMYGVHEEYKLNMSSPFYYILLRDPVERFISHYNFFYKHLGYRGLKGVHLNDVEEKMLKDLLTRMSNIQLSHLINGVNFIKSRQSFIAKLRRVGKSQIRALSKGKFFPARPVGIRADQSWLEEAERLLEQEYGAFGIVEKMDLSLKYLQASSPLWLKFYENTFPVRNEKKPADDEPVNEKIIAAIQSFNQYDYMLYEMAEKLLDKKSQMLNV